MFTWTWRRTTLVLGMKIVIISVISHTCDATVRVFRPLNCRSGEMSISVTPPPPQTKKLWYYVPYFIVKNKTKRLGHDKIPRGSGITIN